MPDTNLQIVLELNGLPDEQGHVRLDDLLEELSALRAALDNIDRTVDQTRTTTLYYRVIDAKHSSPLKIVLEPVKKKKLPRRFIVDVAKRHDRFFKELATIKATGTASEDIDSATLESFKRLVSNMGKKFSEVRLSNHSESVQLDTSFKDKVSALLEREFYSQGSIEGKLEAINIHGGTNTFWIYPDTGPTKILCKFPAGTKDRAKSAIDRIVRVTGRKIFRPHALFPHRVEVVDFEILPEGSPRTSIHDMGGIAPTQPGEEGSVDQVRRMRDEW